jgi:hypothetical protein
VCSATVIAQGPSAPALEAVCGTCAGFGLRHWSSVDVCVTPVRVAQSASGISPITRSSPHEVAARRQRADAWPSRKTSGDVRSSMRSPL